MKLANIDGIRFNVAAVKDMSLEKFAECHAVQVGVKVLGLSHDNAQKWAEETYNAIVSSGKKETAKPKK